jgi:GNAT superfamily N-acetyltransferase
MLVEPLGRQHDRALFSCGNPTLDEYLKQRARQDARRYVAAPFVLIPAAGERTILGYYTLSSFAVDLVDLPPDTAGKLPSYPNVPVTLLGRLAVDHRHAGQGLGEFLLMDALHRSLTQSSQIAAVAVVVDAIDGNAVRFYTHFTSPFPNVQSPFPAHTDHRASVRMI